MLGASQPTDNELSLSASSGVFFNLESHDSSDIFFNLCTRDITMKTNLSV